MVKVIIDSGGRVGDSKHVKKCGLFDFFIGIEIRLQAWKNLFPDSCQKLGIIKRREEDTFRMEDQIPFMGSVVQKIGLYPKGNHFGDSSEPASQCNKSSLFLNHLSYLW